MNNGSVVIMRTTIRSKAVISSIVAFGVGSASCGHALAQTQYYPYQQPYAPYQAQQQYQYPYSSYQYAPAQQQYAPAQQYSAPYQQQQYAPSQQYTTTPQYAPTQAAYTQMPDYCSTNNAATGAVVGSLLGAAIGGAIGGGRGAMIGAGSGMLFGGLSGAQADTQCQQIAVQRAYEYAAAQQAAIQAQIAQQAATQRGQLSLPASAYEPVTVDYSTPSNNRRHRVTVKRLNSYSEPASRQICDTFTRIDTDLDSGQSSTSTARRCKGPDGQWREA
jgi:uncharacterized protein YcfJ